MRELIINERQDKCTSRVLSSVNQWHFPILLLSHIVIIAYSIVIPADNERKGGPGLLGKYWQIAGIGYYAASSHRCHVVKIYVGENRQQNPRGHTYIILVYKNSDLNCTHL